MAVEQAHNPADVPTIEAYWTNMLTLVASADVDQQAAQQLGQVLAQLKAQTDDPSVYQSTVAALNAAQSAIQSMAGQTITDNRGQTIVADDGVLKTFTTTGAQYKDTSLFGTPGGTNTALAIGETAASVGIGSQFYIAPNGPTNQLLSGYLVDLIQRAATSPNAITPHTGVEQAITAWMGGGLEWPVSKLIVKLKFGRINTR